MNALLHPDAARPRSACRRDTLLHAAEELHDGLIVIVPNVSRDEQLWLFALVIDHLGLSPDLVNRVLEIDAGGNIVVEALAAG